MATSRRNQLIRLVHIAKRDLKMDDAIYRTMLKAAGGKDSTADMDVAALERVLAQAKRAGFQIRSKAGDRRQDTRPMATKVRALWLFLHHLGAVKNPSEAALAAYVKRIARVDDMHWASGDAMNALVETLKKWAMRGFLPEAVQQLRTHAGRLAGVDQLSAVQLEALQKADRLVTHGDPTFDRLWQAWALFTVVVGREVPRDVSLGLEQTR